MKMQIDDFLELVKSRRSIRVFKPDPVPRETIEKILEAARWAMSGANGQPWEFVVVQDRARILLTFMPLHPGRTELSLKHTFGKN
jgi:nitroreductase